MVPGLGQLSTAARAIISASTAQPATQTIPTHRAALPTESGGAEPRTHRHRNRRDCSPRTAPQAIWASPSVVKASASTTTGRPCGPVTLNEAASDQHPASATLLASCRHTSPKGSRYRMKAPGR